MYNMYRYIHTSIFHIYPGIVNLLILFVVIKMIVQIAEISNLKSMEFTKISHDLYLLVFVQKDLKNGYVENSWNKVGFWSYSIPFIMEIKVLHNCYEVSCGHRWTPLLLPIIDIRYKRWLCVIIVEVWYITNSHKNNYNEHTLYSWFNFNLKLLYTLVWCI